MHEDDLLASLPALFATGDSGVLTGTGPDDCAHVVAGGPYISVSTDAFVEGSHFLSDADPALVARKSLAASLSDLAASACRARWVTVCLCLKKGAPADWAERFARGMAETARDCGVTVVGGDTVSSPLATFVSVTVIGEPLAGGPVLRSGGRPGDQLIVTGALGGSLLGRHLRPAPRLGEIRFLMDFCGRLDKEIFPSAAMDISDGLALDLHRLCRESGTGAIIHADLVPIAPEAVEAAAGSGRSPLHHALTDGEDFELLLALPPALWQAFQTYRGSPEGCRAAEGLAPFTRIGSLRAEQGLVLETRDGGLCPLEPEGYQHQW